MDGNWKLAFPICMFPVRTSVPALAGVNYPGVCINQPSGNSAFCMQHLTAAKEIGYPTNVKAFRRFLYGSASKFIIVI